ncbi:MAG: hypothetical protein ACI35O_12125 [Bacillaceae bacterium]
MSKQTRTKLLVSLLAIILFVGGYFAYKQFFAGAKGAKEITITVVDESKNKTLVDKEKFHTDAKNLGDFLEENKDELGVTMDDSQYGRFVSAVKGIKTEDMNKGPWWMYGYKSKEKNLEMKVGQAPGVDELGLHNGDEVEFVFTTNTGM